MSHEEHHHDQPSKKVYWGIPIGFAFSFWLIVFLSMKACDTSSCCKNGKECSKECMEKCKAEGKECGMDGGDNEKLEKENNNLEGVGNSEDHSSTQETSITNEGQRKDSVDAKKDVEAPSQAGQKEDH